MEDSQKAFGKASLGEPPRSSMMNWKVVLSKVTKKKTRAREDEKKSAVAKKRLRKRGGVHKIYHHDSIVMYLCNCWITGMTVTSYIVSKFIKDVGQTTAIPV